MSKAPEEIAHLEWLGYVQPTGLVVSIPAMLSAQCFVNKNMLPEHQRFLNCLPRDKHDDVIPEIQDFTQFVQEVFDWRTRDLVGLSGGDSIPRRCKWRCPNTTRLSARHSPFPKHHPLVPPLRLKSGSGCC